MGLAGVLVHLQKEPCRLGISRIQKVEAGTVQLRGTQHCCEVSKED